MFEIIIGLCALYACAKLAQIAEASICIAEGLERLGDLVEAMDNGDAE